MQPGTNPDDLRDILSRFQSWAEKQPHTGNGNRHTNGLEAEEIREIPYEEAIRQYRKRQSHQARPRIQPAIAAADAPERIDPQATAEAHVPAVVVRDAVADAAASLSPETAPAIATVQPQTDVTEIMPWAIAPAERPARTIKDPANEGAAQPKELKRRASTTQPKSLSPEVGVQASPPLDKAAETEAAARLVVQAKALSARYAAPSSAKAANQVIPQMKRHAPSGLAKPDVQVAPRSKRLETSSLAKPAIQARPRITKLAASGPSKAANQMRGQAIKQAAGASAAAKCAVPAAAISRRKTHPAFRRILANSVHAKPAEGVKKAAPKKQAPPDRSRRITTRFSTAEQRRIEKQAAQAGLTVSAWLRRCVLAQSGSLTNPQAPNTPKAEKRGPAPSHSASAEVTLFAPAASSTLGNWLTLLRQRFLASPHRFSERA